jgi:hypothetical protein
MRIIDMILEAVSLCSRVGSEDRVERNMSQQSPDGVEINARTKQVGRGCATNRMRAYAFGLQPRSLYGRAFRMTRDERVDSESRYGSISTEE